MANALYRLGRAAFDRRRPAAAAWAAMLAVAVAAALSLAKPTATSFNLPGTESDRALGILETKFPALGADGATARVVIGVPVGQQVTDPANTARIGAVVEALGTVPQVARVLDPFEVKSISLLRNMVYVQIGFAVPATQITGAAREALMTVAAQGRSSGLRVEVGGDALLVPTSVDGQEGIGVLLAAVILALTLGSLVAAGLPLLTAVFGIGIGISGIGVATHFVTLSSFTPILALMLGLAVAIDYSLFIVSRYRHELATDRAPADAAGQAVATAGSAVVFAGSTVVIALVALAVVNIPLITEMGLAAALTVAISVLASLTLLPAMLGFLGRRLRPAADPEGDPTRPGLAVRWARLVTRRPVPVIAVAAASLLLIAIPVLDLRLGLPDDSTAAPSTTQRKAYDLLSANFVPGINGPLVVVVDATTSADPPAAAAAAADAVRALVGVAFVTAPTFDPAGTVALVQVIPFSGPSTAATETLVRAIRAASEGLRVQTGATLAVTGRTALNIDISARMQDALLPYLVIVVGLAVLLLTIVFRSILVPLKAAAGFVLSLAATLGSIVAVFQWGWLGGLLGVGANGPVLSLLPMLVIALVFGLAMDYEVFLVSRMREEHSLGAEPTAAVVTGFAHGAKVVTAAALIMIAVFAGFVLSADQLIKSFGFALAAAVLFDAFVVRLTIAPAAMALLGRAAWWLPGWLDRLLPSLDVEGARGGASEAVPHAPEPEVVDG